MKAGLVFSKRTKLIFRDNVAILVVEFSSVAQVFMHDGGTVLDVLCAEDVGKFMNYSNDVRFRFGMCARVTKWLIDWGDDIIPQSLLTIAYSVNPRPTGNKILT
jgi:hypothetical protein